MSRRQTFSTAENQFSRLRSSIWMWDVCSSITLTLRAKPGIKERISLMLLVRISFLYLKQKEHFGTKEFGGNNYYFYCFYHDQLWQEILTFLYIFKKNWLEKKFLCESEIFFPTQLMKKKIYHGKNSWFFFSTHTREKTFLLKKNKLIYFHTGRKNLSWKIFLTQFVSFWNYSRHFYLFI